METDFEKTQTAFIPAVYHFWTVGKYPIVGYCDIDADLTKLDIPKQKNYE